MQRLEHKRGDSFTFTAVWRDDDAARDFTGLTAAAMIKTVADVLVAELTTDVTIETGVVTIEVSATMEAAAEWRTGKHLFDVELTLGAERWSTPTFTLEVLPDVTRPA